MDLSAFRMSLRSSDGSGSGKTVASTDLGGQGFEHLFVIHLLLVDAQPVEQTWWQDKLDQESPHQREGSKGKTYSLLNWVQLGGLESTSAELNEHKLHADDQEEDGNESKVVAESSEHVVFVVQQLSGINHVEDLHEDKGLEHNGVDMALVGGLVQDQSVSHDSLWVGQCKVIKPFLINIERIRVLVRQVEPVSAEEQEEKENNDLIDGMSHDVSPHD